MTDDAAGPLAQHVCRTRYADLPASAIEAACRDILDTFGCMLGGSGSPGINHNDVTALEWSGNGPLSSSTDHCLTASPER